VVESRSRCNVYDRIEVLELELKHKLDGLREERMAETYAKENE
jgi:hypothetical protein